MRLRPYVTNKRLPDALKFPEGTIETIVQAGMCDNAARMLKFILKQRGYDSVQWNMVTDGAAHSALLVNLPNGRKGFVDPFYGYAAVENGKLISAREAQALVRDGAATEKVLEALGPKSKVNFYKNFAKVSMSAEGQTFVIADNLPDLKDKLLIEIGNVNGDSEDVKKASGEYGLSSHWDYMGHKYNREWVREMISSKDVRLEMTLLADAEEGVLIAEPKPQVDGKVLRWDLKAGEKIIFRDGLAKISWRRLNSYIGVDQIKIMPKD